MTITRAERVRRDIQTAAAAGMTTEQYAGTVLDLLRVAVPFDAVCLATTDPSTTLLTSSYKLGIDDARDHEFAHYEYLVDDVNLYQDLARGPAPVGVLLDDTDGDPARSPRWREFLIPHFGLEHEMRAVLATGGETWGLVGLYRQGRSRFSPAEAAFLATLAPSVAAGLRASVVTRHAAEASLSPPAGPAVLVVGGNGEVVSATPAAAKTLSAIDPRGATSLPTPIQVLVAAARAFGQQRRPAPPRLRLRTDTLGWLVLDAAPLHDTDGRAGDIVITISPAGAHDLAQLLVSAYGLTTSERRVISGVLGGESTDQIARRLHLSPYTVQDHLKSIFSKADVRSRRELTARVFFHHYAPRLDQPLTPTGWFVDSPPADDASRVLG